MLLLAFRPITKVHFPARKKSKPNCKGLYAVWKDSSACHLKTAVQITIHHLLIWKMHRLAYLLFVQILPMVKKYKFKIRNFWPVLFFRDLLRSCSLVFRLAMKDLRLTMTTCFLYFIQSFFFSIPGFLFWLVMRVNWGKMVVE